jgi:hypothetical protein
MIEPVNKTARGAGLASTATILCVLMLTIVALPAGSAVEVFTAAAVGVGISLSAATVIEATAGVRNLIRVDLLILWVLYGLTFFEFLFPQVDVDAVVSPEAAINGTNAALLGFAGLVVGRHLVPRRSGSRPLPAFMDARPSNIFLLFVLATLLGYLHVFVAVDFNPFELLRQMSLPRFLQSWSRGKFGGDAFSLLVEVGALIYLIPPIAGLVFARSKDYRVGQKVVVTIVLAFTFYFGFALGTRYVLVTYVFTFLGAYFLNKPNLKLWQVLYQGVPILVVLVIGTVYMLEFRNVGLGKFSLLESRSDTLFVDHNMVTLSRITDLFPNLYGFLGFEVPFLGLIHPIPRIIWPGKPEGLSVSLEAALGYDPATVTFAATFVGEAYMAGGLLAVMLGALLFGAAAEMWNRVGRDLSSPFAQLLYSSGFFCAALTMRSMVWMSVTMLPTLALWLYARLWFPRSSPRGAAAARRPSGW